MSQELPTAANTIMLKLQAKPIAVAEPDTTVWTETYPIASPQVEVLTLDQATEKPSYVAPYTAKPKVSGAIEGKIIAWDTEATGLNPWEYRMLVCTFWDLSKPISEMITFAGWDEEVLTQQCADYLNEEQPDGLVGYNIGYDHRNLATRLMQYHIRCPVFFRCKGIDVLTLLQRGSFDTFYSNQPSGSEEQWLTYFFGEKKPYSIEECFQGVRDGDLKPLIIRNRSCVESEGEIYKLLLYVSQAEEQPEAEVKPTLSRIEEEYAAGVALVKCTVCEAVNTVPATSKGNQCWRCLSPITDPTAATIIKEQLREFDYSKVGVTEKKTTASTKT